MTLLKAITQLCFSSNVAGIVANEIEQNFYSVYSYSGIEIEERFHSFPRDIKDKEKGGHVGVPNNRRWLILLHQHGGHDVT